MISNSRLFRRDGILSGSQCGMQCFLLIAAFITLMPFYWMVITSFREDTEIFSGVFHWLPQHWIGFVNYAYAFTHAPLWRFMFNGLIVCFGVLTVQLATAIPAAWALARYRFVGKNALFLVVLLGLAIPIQAPAIPLFLGLAKFDLLDSYLAIMFPFFISVFAIFLFQQNFKQFPEEIVEAARMDGMSEAAILWKVVVPSMRPAIAAFAIFSFVAHWNDLYWPLIVVTSPEMSTPPLGMAQFSDPETGTKYGPLMAAATVLTLPILAFFLALQREFMDSMTSSAVK